MGLSTGEKVHDRASHARVVHFEGDPNDAGRAIKAIEGNVVPALKQMPSQSSTARQVFVPVFLQPLYTLNDECRTRSSTG